MQQGLMTSMQPEEPSMQPWLPHLPRPILTQSSPSMHNRSGLSYGNPNSRNPRNSISPLQGLMLHP